MEELELVEIESQNDLSNHTKTVKFVVISDTHNLHWELQLPDADVLVHGGDFTDYGMINEVIDFNKWLGTIKHKFKYIIIVPGNHEFFPDAIGMLLTNCTHYLKNGYIEIEGIKIFGARFKSKWNILPFGRPKDAITKWHEVIPIDKPIDILITHIPPYLTDLDHRFFICGQRELATHVKLVNPHVHIHGHHHANHGVRKPSHYKHKLKEYQLNTTFINAASKKMGRGEDEESQEVNKPIGFEFKK